jgi:hypothetical protein
MGHTVQHAYLACGHDCNLIAWCRQHLLCQGVGNLQDKADTQTYAQLSRQMLADVSPVRLGLAHEGR